VLLLFPVMAAPVVLRRIVCMGIAVALIINMGVHPLARGLPEKQDKGCSTV
jgi:hypothetical protein